MIKKKGFPKEGEVVLVTVKNITPYSALCTLDEYEGREGMIHVSEISGKWVRDIKKFVKIGKQYVAKVVEVDEKKGHITLSLKRLSKRNKDQKLQDFKNEGRSEKMIEALAKRMKITPQEAYEKIGADLQEKFGDVFTAFNMAFENPEALVRRGIPEKTALLIQEVAKEEIQKKEKIIKADLCLKFYTEDGVAKIKSFLIGIKQKYGWEVKYISAPHYSIEMKTKNPKKAEKKLKEKLGEEISKIKGGEASFAIKGV